MPCKLPIPVYFPESKVSFKGPKFKCQGGPRSLYKAKGTGGDGGQQHSLLSLQMASFLVTLYKTLENLLCCQSVALRINQCLLPTYSHLFFKPGIS